MFEIHEGQCGMCTHFGQHHRNDEQLQQIRANLEAPEDFRDECGHPQHVTLHLMVTAISGCDAFEPAPVCEQAET